MSAVFMYPVISCRGPLYVSSMPSLLVGKWHDKRSKAVVDQSLETSIYHQTFIHLHRDAHFLHIPEILCPPTTVPGIHLWLLFGAAGGHGAWTRELIPWTKTSQIAICTGNSKRSLFPRGKS